MRAAGERLRQREDASTLNSIDSITVSVLAWLAFNLQVAWQAVQERVGEMTSPSFIALVLLILTLERLIPARPNQKILSASMFQDMVWFLIQAVGAATILAAWTVFLRGIYDRHLDFLTITSIAALPAWVGVALGVVFTDFLAWAQHVLQHKVPWFWQFHVVHHSQRNLNLFTDFRYHVFEYLVRQTIITFPLMMFGLRPTEVVLILLFLLWHARLYHSNIRTDLGFLRYIIVTPQSHRIHHSIEARHRDRNFGSFLSIWDRMFGTQFPGHSEYPETGVSEQHFPNDEPALGLNLVLKPIEQMIYPFIAIGRSLYRRARPHEAGG
jgi:sterol desaturase/sphingolipid hydroxylase (fatty acid hydroxylase superfamily)